MTFVYKAKPAIKRFFFSYKYFSLPIIRHRYLNACIIEKKHTLEMQDQTLLTAQQGILYKTHTKMLKEIFLSKNFRFFQTPQTRKQHTSNAVTHNDLNHPLAS